MAQTDLTRRKFLVSAAVTSAAALTERPIAASQVKAGSAQMAVVMPRVALKAVPFPLEQVRLLPSPWKDMAELNRSFLYSLPNDRLAHNFRVTAGMVSTADPLGGWEAPDCELRGHYVGHYLTACALVHATTGDEEIRGKADALVAMLAECQAQDGYLGAYPTSFYDRLRRHEEVWAPFYTYHKILAGMLDMHQHAGNAQALVVAMRMADWADAYSQSVPADEWQKVLLTEQGGMNEAAFNLYGLTGQTKYRELGFRFEHHLIFDPLAEGKDELNDHHANTNIPKVIGAARGYELTGDARYRKISQTFYDEVVAHHTYCTGGTSNGEMWAKPDAIATELGPDAEECCCSYNMMKLSRLMFAREPDAKYFDYYERLLVNVRQGTQDRDGMLMYYVPLEAGMYKTFGTPFGAFWCCTGTGSEEYAKLTDSIYFRGEDAVYVNLFLASTLDWKERGMRVVQTTKFPHEGRVTLTVESAPVKTTALKVRKPYWAVDGMRVAVNGTEVTASADGVGYMAIAHAWKPGDVVTIDLPLTLHVNKANDDARVQAAMYGPVVLAAVLGTDGLTTGMIYDGMRPDNKSGAMPLPEIAGSGVWFEQVEGTAKYPLRFKSKGGGVVHTLAPLSAITDERYSVYLRNVSLNNGAMGI